MLGLISFLVVFVVLVATLRLIFVTLDNASHAITSAIMGDRPDRIATVQFRSRGKRHFTIRQSAFAPLRAAA